MLAVHWKAPLQPKGFLKIVELVVAILAFSLVAGYTIRGTVTCNDESEISVDVQSEYPFFEYDTMSSKNGAPNSSRTGIPFAQHIISGQFFVTWGVLTMIYCIVAVVIYMLFTANENLERVVDMLIYFDLGFHVVWVLGWFIASIDWAVGFNHIRSMFNGVLDQKKAMCPITSPTSAYTSPDTFVQASIADVFGFLSFFLWAVNIYWVLIDTAWFIQWRSRRAASQY